MYYRRRQSQPVDIETFSEKSKYTSAELEEYATAILKQDRKDSKNDHNILFEDQLYNKKKREVLVDASEIDGTLTNSMQDKEKPGVYKGDQQKMYNRSHPLGRKTNTDLARKTLGASYYRN